MLYAITCYIIPGTYEQMYNRKHNIYSVKSSLFKFEIV